MSTINQSNYQWAKRIAKSYQIIAILGLNMLIVFAIAEVTAYAYLQSVTEPFKESRAELSYYVDEEWSEQYWQEFRLPKRSYEPFTIWRRNPFSGEQINIDQNGLRVVPNSDCQPDQFKIFMFGGSTMWGTGAPDNGTIPSYFLQEITAQLGRPVCVINYGESAYTSTQGVIQLISELHQGNRPDYVIFYDGVNDSHAVFTSSQQWTHANLSGIARRFEPPVPLRRQNLRSLNLYKVAGRIRSRNAEKQIPSFDSDMSTLADYVYTTYESNNKIVDALSKEYNFEYAFFWQPVLGYGEKALTVEEDEMSDSANLVEMSFNGTVYNRLGFIHAAYDHVTPRLNNLRNVHDLTSILDNERQLAYIDFVHVTPQANQLIAAKMFELLQSSLSEQIDHTP